MAGCTLPEAGSMSWIWVPSSFVTATATGCPVSSSCTLKIGPTTAVPSKTRSFLMPFSPMPKIKVVAPFDTAKTLPVLCHFESLNSPSVGRSKLLPTPPHMGAALSWPFTSVTTNASTTMKVPRRRPVPTTFGNSSVLATLPVSAFTCTEAGLPPSASALIAQMVPASSGEEAAAQNAAFRAESAWPVVRDHSCLPAMVRASISPLRKTATVCFAAGPSKSKSSTGSE
mmetsp:Transcript_32319/g.106678  ORF Transcript_32319/g.106678 Transcript_32319/m.106678 type:complete len:228 (-) Transcript_32319:451-1134(-)